jgi:hypothetical protein
MKWLGFKKNRKFSKWLKVFEGLEGCQYPLCLVVEWISQNLKPEEVFEDEGKK